MLRSPVPVQIPDALWAAYVDTLFVYRAGSVQGVSEVGVLQVGQLPDATTVALLQDATIPSAVFITAYNPQHGHDQVAERNMARQCALRDRLDRLGRVYYPGAGLGRDAKWDPEASLFVIGVTEAEAIALGSDCGQNAVVWVQCDSPVRLLVSR